MMLAERERAETVGLVLRWTLFVLALPLCAFISFMGWIGTDFGGLTDSIPMLMVLPVQACAFRSFRIAAWALWLLLAFDLLLPLRFGHLHLSWSDLAPAKIDVFFWAAAILMGLAALIPSSRRGDSKVSIG